MKSSRGIRRSAELRASGGLRMSAELRGSSELKRSTTDVRSPGVSDVNKVSKSPKLGSRSPKLGSRSPKLGSNSPPSAPPHFLPYEYAKTYPQSPLKNRSRLSNSPRVSYP